MALFRAPLGARFRVRSSLKAEMPSNLRIKRAPFVVLGTHMPQSSSFLGLPYRILNMNPKKELLWGLWVTL